MSCNKRNNDPQEQRSINVRLQQLASLRKNMRAQVIAERLVLRQGLGLARRHQDAHKLAHWRHGSGSDMGGWDARGMLKIIQPLGTIPVGPTVLNAVARCRAVRPSTVARPQTSSAATGRARGRAGPPPAAAGPRTTTAVSSRGIARAVGPITRAGSGTSNSVTAGARAGAGLCSITGTGGVPACAGSRWSTGTGRDTSRAVFGRLSSGGTGGARARACASAHSNTGARTPRRSPHRRTDVARRSGGPRPIAASPVPRRTRPRHKPVAACLHNHVV